MSAELTWIIIASLISIIIGGAGGAALFRNTAKKFMPPGMDSTEMQAYADSAKAAAHAAEAASDIAKAFRDTVSVQLTELKTSLKDQNLMLDKLTSEQAKMSTRLDQFPGLCAEKHRRIDENLARVQQEIEKFRN